jgi:hypothetical protein
MTEPTPGGWSPCPPGELGRLAAWLRFRRRLRAAAWTALGLVAAGTLAGAARLAYPVLGAGPAPSGAPCCHDTPAEQPPAPCSEGTPADKK